MEKRNVQITIEQAKEWLKNDQLKEIALEAFPELKEKSLPKTWEELKKISGFYVNEDSETACTNNLDTSEKVHRNVFTNAEQAEASIALAQLSQLRDVYRNGFVPDWTDIDRIKYCIEFYDDKIYKDEYTATAQFLSFQDYETRNLFLENFEELILKATPLMS
jgi:hypothetical protein